MLEYIKPTRESGPLLVGMVFHPFNYTVFGFASLFFFFFFAENRYGGPSLIGQILYTIVWSIYYFLVLAVFIRYLSNYFVRRNVPLFWVVVLSFFTASVTEATIGLFISPETNGGPHFFWHVFAMLSVSTPGIMLNMFYHEKNARKAFCDDIDLVPYWMPVKQLDEPLLLKLPQHLRGPLLYMHAANQYVYVHTTKGSHKLRMTLTDAVAALVKKKGIKIHRSYWLCENEVRRLVYVDGNPRVLNSSGQKLPVSRSQIKNVKAVLEKAQRLKRS